MHSTYDRGELISRYIREESFRLRNLAQTTGYNVTPEPPSALFVSAAEVKFVGINDAYDPLKASVETRVQAEWRPEAVQMMKKLEAAKVDFKAVARTGAPYMQYPVKKISRWVKQERSLIEETHQLWTLPWWEHFGRPKFIEMLTRFSELTQQNIQTLRAQPELLLVGKPEGTGTGWDFPADTRLAMSRNFDARSDMYASVTKQYYDDMISAIEVWPEHDSLITLGGGYKGIAGGVRSDGDVTGWYGTQQTLSSSTREVGNDPSSAFHGPGLNDRATRNALMEFTYSDIHMPQNDTESYIKALTTPPASIDGEPDDMVLLSADFGYVAPAPTATDRTLTIPDPKINFGADNISLAGIMLRTGPGKTIAMLKSGTPYTMAHYNILFGEALSYYAHENSLHIEFLQVGDDAHMIMPRDEVPVLLSTPLAPYLKLKGMHDDTVFILGHQVVHRPGGRLVSYVVPRILKSQTSARQNAGDFPTSIEPGETQRYTIDDEVSASIANYYRVYADLMYYEGDRLEYAARLREIYAAGKMEMAQMGISPWMLEGFDLGDQPLDQVELDVPRTDDSDFTEAREDQASGTPNVIGSKGVTVAGYPPVLVQLTDELEIQLELWNTKRYQAVIGLTFFDDEFEFPTSERILLVTDDIGVLRLRPNPLIITIRAWDALEQEDKDALEHRAVQGAQMCELPESAIYRGSKEVDLSKVDTEVHREEEEAAAEEPELETDSDSSEKEEGFLPDQ